MDGWMDGWVDGFQNNSSAGCSVEARNTVTRFRLCVKNMTNLKALALIIA